MAAVGLQTFKWENNFKSTILLIMFPILLSIVGLLILFAFNVIKDSELSSNNDSNYVRTYDYATKKYVYTYPTAVAKDPVKETVDAIPVVAPIFFIITGVWFLIAWVGNRKMITSFTHAQPLDRTNNPRVYNIVENLCISRGLPVPKIYIIEESSLNAFASGLSPKNAIMCFTRGLVNSLDDSELEAVAAHELTHIMNNDIKLMVIAIVFVGIIQTMAWVFMRVRISGKKNDGAGVFILIQVVVFVLSFVFAAVVQAAMSQKREFLADAGSTELVKSSQPLINALQKISANSHVQAVDNANVAQMFIVNPLTDGEGGIMRKLFATHPSINERIKALQLIDAGSTTNNIVQ